MASNEIKMVVDVKGLDEAIEKANRLMELLAEVQEIINSLSEIKIKVC